MIRNELAKLGLTLKVVFILEVLLCVVAYFEPISRLSGAPDPELKASAISLLAPSFSANYVMSVIIIVGSIAMVLLGAISGGGEYGWKTAGHTLTAAPAWNVAGTKLLTGLIVAVSAVGVSLVLGQLISVSWTALNSDTAVNHSYDLGLMLTRFAIASFSLTYWYGWGLLIALLTRSTLVSVIGVITYMFIESAVTPSLLNLPLGQGMLPFAAQTSMMKFFEFSSYAGIMPAPPILQYLLPQYGIAAAAFYSVLITVATMSILRYRDYLAR